MAEYLNVPDRSLFIGDNLEILRGINTDAVDFVYLDPPRNSGRTHSASSKSMAAGVSYDDTWSERDIRQEWTEEIGVRGPDALLAINAAKVLQGAGMAGYLTFMTVRLLELRRVLKPSGSIYLQCDPHTVHYLRAVMDAIFGSENFKNEVSWRRDRLVAGNRRWAWHHDTILFYAGPHKHRWHRLNQEPPPEYWGNFIYEDEVGRFYTSPLVFRGPGSSDEDGGLWRGWEPRRDGRHWGPPMDILKELYPDDKGLDGYSVQTKLDMLSERGLVLLPRFGLPRLKRYENHSDGTLLQDIVTTIPPVRKRLGEDCGWPGQKPQALLDLFIKLSTDPQNPKKPNSEAGEADIVLDPFCGSGTACLAAELSGRRWVGIEQAPQAEKILGQRLGERGLREPLVYGEAPRRTDLEEEPVDMDSEKGLPRLISDELDYPTVRPALYGLQDGRCIGCNHEMPEHALLTDRLVFPARAEHDSLDNLVLVCHSCRVIRMAEPLSYLELENRRQETYRASGVSS